MGICTTMIETKRMNLHKELYFLINTQKSASISFDQMTMLKEVPKKLKPYFDYVLQHYFIDDVKQHDSVDFDTFLDLCVACDSISTNVCCTTANDQSIISQSSKTESQNVSRKSVVHEAFAHWMAPVKDKEIGEIIEILERLGETSTDTEGIMSLNQALGLASRASMDIMYHPKKYKEKMDSEFLTETELSVIIDKLAEQGIDVTSIISNSTLNNASEAAISALASQSLHNESYLNINHADKQSQLVKLLIKEYDCTHSGTLSSIETNNLFRNIKREIEAHKLFVGSNLKVIGDYITGRTLGFGQSGIVKCAVKRDTFQEQHVLSHLEDHTEKVEIQEPKQVALKITKLNRKTKMGEFILSPEEQQTYCQPTTEIELLTHIQNHQQIIQLFDHFIFQDPTSKSSWQVQALQLCGGGSLSEYRASTSITEPMARYFFTQIILAVEELHKVGYAHMDIRLENVLLDNDGGARLCDFGTALKFTQDGDDLVKCGTIAGTLSHMPPEVLEFQNDYRGTQVDMYSCGVLLYQLLTGRNPFQIKNGNDTQVINNILTGKFEPLGLEFSRAARQLCNALMSDDPDERPTATHTLESDWIQQEMIRPAMAKGIILLDPMPGIMDLEMKLTQILKDEQLIIKIAEIPKDQTNIVIRLTAKNQDATLLFSITGERVNAEKEEQDYFNLQFQAMQSTKGQNIMENLTINTFQINETSLKLSFFMKHGILWEFQKLFRRIRYCILNQYSRHESKASLAINDTLLHDLSSSTEEQMRTDFKPAVDSVISLQLHTNDGGQHPGYEMVIKRQNSFCE